jgi:hypothetical protein
MTDDQHDRQPGWADDERALAEPAAVTSLADFDNDVVASTTQILSSLLATRLVRAQIAPDRWPAGDLTRPALGLVLQIGLTSEMTDLDEDFLRWENET